MVVAATEKRFIKLQGDLNAMGYTEPLGIESVPIVERLFADLVTTTQSYENLSNSSKKLSDSLALANNSMYPLKKENGRLIKENNKLHLELIRKAEEQDETLRLWKDEVTKLQKVSKEKDFKDTFREQTIAKHEREIAALRQRCSHLLQRSLVSEPLGAGGVKKDAFRASGGISQQSFDLNSTLDASVSYQGDIKNESRDTFSKSLNKTSSTTILKNEKEADIAANLNDQVENLKEDIARYKSEIVALKKSVATREKEIERLGNNNALNSDTEKTSLDHINKTNSQIVAQLNGQIDFLTGQLAEQEKLIRVLNDKKKGVDGDAISAKLKVKEVTDTNKRLANEVRELENKHRSMLEIQRAENARGAAANEMAASEVSGARERMRICEEQLQAKEEMLSNALEERNRLAKIIQTYKSDKEKVSDAIENSEHDRRRVEQENIKLNETISRLRSDLDVARKDASHLETKVSSLVREVETYQQTISQLQINKENDGKSIFEYTRECSQLEDTNTSLTRDNSKLRAEMDKLTHENKNLIAILNETKEKSSTLSNKLQDDSVSRRSELMAIRSLEHESVNLKREVDSLTKLLGDSKKECMELRESLNGLTIEKESFSSRLKTALSEITDLENNLFNEKKKNAEMQESISQLSNLSSLPEVVSSLQTTVTKVRGEAAKYEAQASLAKREGERLTTTISEMSAKLTFISEALSAEQFKYKEQCVHIHDMNVLLDDYKVKIRTLEEEKLVTKGEISHILSDKENRSLVEIDLRKLLQERDDKIQKSEFVIRELEGRITGTNQETGTLKDISERLTLQLNKEREMNAESERTVRELRNQSISFENQISDLKLQLVQHTHTSNLANKRAADSEALRVKLEGDLYEKDNQIRQIKSLLSQLERTREEMNIQASKSWEKIASLETSEAKLANDILIKEKALMDMKGDCERMSTVISSLDEERDILQREVDNKTVQIEDLLRESKEIKSNQDNTKGSMLSMKKQLDAHSEALTIRDREITHLHNSLDKTRSEASILSNQKDLMQNEIASLNHDLATMTRENQSLNADYTSMNSSLLTMKQQLERAVSRANSSDQKAAALMVERDDLLQTYRNVCNERTRLDQHVSNLSLDKNTSDAQLSQANNEINKLLKKIDVLENSNKKFLVELKTYERQTNDLSRQLSTYKTDNESLKAQVNNLNIHVSSTRMVASELSSTDKELRMDSASKAAEVDLLKQRLISTEGTCNSLKVELQSERNHIRELENLIALLRSEKAKSSLSPSFEKEEESESRGVVMEEFTSTTEDYVLTNRLRGGYAMNNSAVVESPLVEVEKSFEDIIRENELLRGELQIAMNNVSPNSTGSKSMSKEESNKKYFPF